MKILKLVASILLAASAGFIGNLATSPNIPTWYATLEKPSFNPPSWVFGPVWSVLYVLIGVSFYFIWTAKTKRSKSWLYGLFAIQLVLNAGWSIVFFGFHQIEAALVVIIALLITILAMIIRYREVSVTASNLLIPYLLWVSFATCLNAAIAIKN